MRKLLKRLFCDWFHGGGDVVRDDQDRINWRCRKCGRWSDHPVSHEEEKAAIIKQTQLTEQKG